MEQKTTNPKEKPADKVEKETVEELDLTDILFDEDNLQPIFLVDGDGNEVGFDQIAVIPHKGKVFAILEPLDEMEGVDENEALVFRLDHDENEKENVLVIEEDPDIAEEVFNLYLKMTDEEQK